MGLFDWLRRRKDNPATTEQSGDAGLGVPHAFLDEVESVLRSLAPTVNAIRRPGQGALAFDLGDGEQLTHLHHLFSELRDVPSAERAGRIEFFVRSILEVGDAIPWEEARGRVFPVLRAGTYGAYLDQRGTLTPQPLRRNVLPFLVELLVLDRPRSMAIINPKNLDDWSVPESEVRRSAHENADTFRNTPLEPYLDQFGGISCLPDDGPNDVYASSRLLLPGWLASMTGRFRGRPLAIVPERGSLFVAGDADPEAARWLAQTAQREWQASTRALSPVVYTADDSGAVVPYRRTDGLCELLRRGEGMLLAKEYAEQKLLLDEIHERDGIDLFVAKATLVERQDGRILSYCVWTDGVESLLPETDVVVVQSNPEVKKNGWQLFLPFERARALAGEAWSQAEVPAGPRRFRTPKRIDPGLGSRLETASVPFEEIA